MLYLLLLIWIVITLYGILIVLFALLFYKLSKNTKLVGIFKGRSSYVVYLIPTIKIELHGTDIRRKELGYRDITIIFWFWDFYLEIRWREEVKGS